MDGFSSSTMMLIIIAALTVLAQGTSVDLVITPAIAKTGDTVILACHVTDLPRTDFLRWSKVDMREDQPEDSQWAMATNYIMDAGFKNDRFNASITETGNVVNFFIVIKDIKAGDRGKYKCETSGDHMDSTNFLEVIVAPSSISMFVYAEEGTETEVLGSEEIKFKENEKIKVACEISGANPQPEIRMFLNGRNLLEDDELNIEIKEMVEDVLTENADTEGQYERKYNMIVELKDFPVLFDHVGHMFTCEASTKDSSEIAVSSNFMITMENVRPRLKCDSLAVPLYRQEVDLICEVFSKPEIEKEMSKVYWLEGSAGEEVTEFEITTGITHQAYYLNITHQGKGKSEMKFTVRRAMLTDFHDYYFVAGNAVGETEEKVTLARDYSLDVVDSASSLSTSLSFFISTTALLFCVL